jgi:hypothetical protein
VARATGATRLIGIESLEVRVRMKNSECTIEQYRDGELVRTFTPTGDQTRPWSMNVNGKSFLRTNGWVLSKILPTLIEGSRYTTKVVPYKG